MDQKKYFGSHKYLKKFGSRKNFKSENTLGAKIIESKLILVIIEFDQRKSVININLDEKEILLQRKFRDNI